MSRTRIVKGKYTKIVAGDYNISAEGNIVSNAMTEVREMGETDGVYYGAFERKGSTVNEDFDIHFSLKKDSPYNTVVPMGILDFEGEFENAFFAFNFSLVMSNVDSLKFEILDAEGKEIFAVTNLPEMVIVGSRHPKLVQDIAKKKPVFDPVKPKNTWEWKPLFEMYNTPPVDYTKIGSYVLLWDGFNNEGIYDSTNFNNKTLTAKVTGEKAGVKKTKEVTFSTSGQKAAWVDVKIDKNNKKIETTLRVELVDGGANGIDCVEQDIDPDPKVYVAAKSCPWDKIPASDIRPGNPILKSRTRSFADLEKLAIDGLNYHWGRNSGHQEAKHVKISNEPYEVYINAVNTTEQAMDDVSLVYNTNGDWMRSGNPGSATWSPVSWIGNMVSREAVCYNVGYIKYSNGWGYSREHGEDLEFSFTAAHEIGHEILKSYGTTVYSYGHKGSVNYVTQSRKDDAPAYPASGEIDIMPYYPVDPPHSAFKRYAAAEKDVLGLIWLTKITVQ